MEWGGSVGDKERFCNKAGTRSNSPRLFVTLEIHCANREGIPLSTLDLLLTHCGGDTTAKLDEDYNQNLRGCKFSGVLATNAGRWDDDYQNLRGCKRMHGQAQFPREYHPPKR